MYPVEETGQIIYYIALIKKKTKSENQFQLKYFWLQQNSVTQTVTVTTIILKKSNMALYYTWITHSVQRSKIQI